MVAIDHNTIGDNYFELQSNFDQIRLHRNIQRVERNVTNVLFNNKRDNTKVLICTKSAPSLSIDENRSVEHEWWLECRVYWYRPEILRYTDGYPNVLKYELKCNVWLCQ